MLNLLKIFLVSSISSSSGPFEPRSVGGATCCADKALVTQAGTNRDAPRLSGGKATASILGGATSSADNARVF